jgi:hypothetical protein
MREKTPISETVILMIMHGRKIKKKSKCSGTPQFKFPSN